MRADLNQGESVGFDSKRLTRVAERVENDINEGLYNGAALIVARDAWKKAATVGKLWGIPLPVVTLGVGAVYDGTAVRVGPSVNVGWRVTF